MIPPPSIINRLPPIRGTHAFHLMHRDPRRVFVHCTIATVFARMRTQSNSTNSPSSNSLAAGRKKSPSTVLPSTKVADKVTLLDSSRVEILPHISIVASKAAVHKHAVVRNRVRRRIREALRMLWRSPTPEKYFSPGTDYMISCQPAAAETPFPALIDFLGTGLARISAQLLKPAAVRRPHSPETQQSQQRSEPETRPVGHARAQRSKQQRRSEPAEE